MFLIGEIGSRILQWSVSIGGALVAVFLIFSIVKDAIGYAKGSGSNSIGTQGVGVVEDTASDLTGK